MLISSRIGNNFNAGLNTGHKLFNKMKTKPSKVKALSFKRKKPKPFQIAADGMKVTGPSHEEEGIEARTSEGKPVAEIEGGERIFSKEDTQYMENEAKRIIRMLQTNPQAANQAAQQLGFKIVEMIVEQEKNQREQEGDEDTQDVDQAAEAMNQFSNAGDEEGGVGL